MLIQQQKTFFELFNQNFRHIFVMIVQKFCYFQQKLIFIESNRYVLYVSLKRISFRLKNAKTDTNLHLKNAGLYCIWYKKERKK